MGLLNKIKDKYKHFSAEKAILDNEKAKYQEKRKKAKLQQKIYNIRNREKIVAERKKKIGGIIKSAGKSFNQASSNKGVMSGFNMNYSGNQGNIFNNDPLSSFNQPFKKVVKPNIKKNVKSKPKYVIVKGKAYRVNN